MKGKHTPRNIIGYYIGKIKLHVLFGGRANMGGSSMETHDDFLSLVLYRHKVAAFLFWPSELF